MQKKPIIFQIRPLWGQCEAEDVEAKTAKAEENGKFRNIYSKLKLEWQTFCLIHVAT